MTEICDHCHTSYATEEPHCRRAHGVAYVEKIEADLAEARAENERLMAANERLARHIVRLEKIAQRMLIDD